MFSASSLEVPEGGEKAYTVKLATRPLLEVTVTLGGTSGSDLTLDKTSLTFTATNWNTEQTVTVSAANDNDGENDEATLTHTASGGDYGAVSKDLPVEVIDNDEAALVLSAASIEVPEEGEASYTVKLATEPMGTVTVTLGGTSGSDLTLDKTSLTFTATTWNTAQTVTVSAANDNDGENDEATLTHTASGGGYGAVSKDLPVEVIDNDEVALVLSESSLGVAEGGEQAYTVMLATQPTDDVTVTLGGTSGTDLSLDKTSLTFSDTTWNTAQTVTVSAADDNDSTNNEATLTHTASGGGYGGVSKDLPVTVTDNDTPGLVLSASSLEVPEDGAKAYTVKLATQPTGTVTVTLGGTSGSDLTLDKTSLTFTATTWSVAQTVTVSAADDGDGTNDEATLTHTASGGGYGGVSKDLPVEVIDNDEVALVLSAASIEVPEDGAKAYTVMLATRPTDDVTVTLGGTSGTDLSLDKTSLTFTDTTWSVAQTVTVSAADDGDGTNDEATLTHSASGGGYGGVSKDLPVEVIDNDEVALVLSAASIEVPEDGETSYTVKLATQPTGNVTVTLGGTSGTDLSLDKTSLTFTATTWSVAQTVTVSAADDNDTTNDEATLTHTASGGGYGAVSKDLPVTVTEDDEAALVLSAASIEIPEDGAKAYTVKLATEPTVTVTVTLGGTSGSDLTLDKTSLTFTTTTWNTAQTVTVSADADDDATNDEATLTHTASGGGYGGVSKDLSVEVIDNDAPELIVSESTLDVTEGGNGRYTVKLATRPKSPVTVDVSCPEDETNVQVETELLNFDTSNWNTPKEVRLSVNHDNDDADDTAVVNHAALGGDYDGVSTIVSVKISDDDTAQQLNPSRAWLARFGRTVAEQVLEAVEDRISAPQQPGFDGRLAGQRLYAEPHGEVDTAGLHGAPDGGSQGLHGRDVAAGTALTLTGGTAEGGFAALWTRGAVTRFDGREGTLSLDGEVTTGLAGVDYAHGAWTGGLVSSLSHGEGTYHAPEGSGKVESSFAGLYPWASHKLTEHLTLWGVVGHGEGSLTLTRSGMTPTKVEVDTDMSMAAAGARGSLMTPAETVGPGIDVTADVLALRISSDATSELAASEAEVTRLRLGLEGFWQGLEIADGALVPTFEIGVRQDEGDAETGMGAHVGAALAWSDPASGLSAEASAQGLLTHEDKGLRKREFSGALIWDLRPGSEFGSALSIGHRTGGTARGGADMLLGHGIAQARAAGHNERQLEVTLGHRIPLAHGRLVGTPEIGIGLTDTGRVLRLGWRVGLTRPGDVALDLSMAGVRRETAQGDGPEHEVRLGLRLRF